ncbi:phosphatase PAP2 family protein [Halorientalis salina]|uniref:phosphatase PAP2 family protein n=1 Tax=Halorientalis salina TaxID=2932266 RepID=UPI0010AD6D54|nr:phosphatase PAP2 family protein [Halorientalis salina]
MVEIPFSAQVIAVVLSLVGVAALTIVGPRQLKTTARSFRDRLRAAGPSLGVLAVVLVLNSLIRDAGGDLSWLIGINITGYIHAIEGAIVADIQSLATPALTEYFSFIYVYGYAFLLIFPVVLYLALENAEPLREMTIAYTLNYAIGLVCYTLFISFGPRNLIAEQVQSLLYTDWPKSQLITSQVNRNTNVFPSLHSSLSTTVALLAYRTRAEYPAWTYLAIPIGTSVAIATMYLGIHWATDVVTGIALGVFSVYAAECIRKRTA